MLLDRAIERRLPDRGRRGRRRLGTLVPRRVSADDAQQRRVSWRCGHSAAGCFRSTDRGGRTATTRSGSKPPAARTSRGRCDWRCRSPAWSRCSWRRLVVMSPVLIGMQVDAAGVSGRVAPLARARFIGENYLGPLALTTVFSPYFARLSPGVLWPHTDLSSCNVYAGAPVLTLALWALASRPRRLARWGMFGRGRPSGAAGRGPDPAVPRVSSTYLGPAHAVLQAPGNLPRLRHRVAVDPGPGRRARARPAAPATADCWLAPSPAARPSAPRS